MRVVYYTHTPFLDVAFSRVQTLSSLVELHLVLEVAPESWSTNLFDVPLRSLPDGIISAPEFLDGRFPKPIREYWQGCASFNLMVYNQPKSIHPHTVRTGKSLSRYFDAIKPDILHIDSISLRMLPQLSHLKKMRVVQNIHDVTAHIGEESWRKRLARSATFRHMDKFVLHSSYTEEMFKKYYRVPPESVEMVPLGVYDIYKEWEKPCVQHPDTILFFGRISPYKGLEVFIEAAEKASRHISNCRFLIAGKSYPGYRIPPVPKLDNGCEFQVMEEYLTNVEVASIMKQSAVVVCPYIEASQSGVVLTAYAFEKPVIVTAVGGLPEYVWQNETGLVIPPNDAGALAHAMRDMMENPAKRDAMRSGIRNKKSNELSWEKSSEQLVSLYSSLLTQG